MTSQFQVSQRSYAWLNQVSAGARTVLLTVLLLPSCQTSEAQRPYHYRVTGQAVDAKGQPVARAYVVVDAGLPKTWEDFTYFVAADDSGRFLFYEPEATNDPKKTRYLYATAPLPDQAFSPIRAPFDRLRGLSEPRFSGRPIVIKKNGDADVGAIPIQVWYGMVEIALLDAKGNPLLKDAESWRYAWLRVRNQKRKIITETVLSIADIERAVDVRKSKIEIALPEGTWYVEVSPRENKGPWLRSPRALHVRTNQSPFQQILKLSN